MNGGRGNDRPSAYMDWLLKSLLVGSVGFGVRAVDKLSDKVGIIAQEMAVTNTEVKNHEGRISRLEFKEKH